VALSTPNTQLKNQLPITPKLLPLPALPSLLSQS
jgi:hypothetical protein